MYIYKQSFKTGKSSLLTTFSKGLKIKICIFTIVITRIEEPGLEVFRDKICQKNKWQSLISKPVNQGYYIIILMINSV